MKSTLTVIVVVALVAIAGLGGYFAGNSFGPNAQALSTINQFRAARGFGGQGGAGQFGQGGQFNQGGQPSQGGQFAAGRRPVAFGTVKSVQGNTIQVTDTNGSVTTVTTDSKTVIEKTVQGALTDIQPGERVTVMGSQSNGTVTATQISIQPSQASAQQ